MATYILESPNFEGQVRIAYSPLGLLVRIDATQAELDEKQMAYIFSSVPLLRELVKNWNTGRGKLTELPDQPPTFDDFWAAYAKGNTEFCGPKIKAKASWVKLTLTEQVAALKYIPKYLRHKGDTSQNIAYASTFLNQKTWE